MNRHHIYWIGIRESELEDTGSLFTGSITIFGSGKKNNYAFDKEYHLRYDYNQDSEILNLFINQKAQIIVKKDPEARFMLYYPVDITILKPEIAERTLYVNDIHMIEFLDDKIKTRMWLCEHIPLPPFTVEEGRSIHYKNLKALFPGYEKFVIQADYSCGGSGTWVLTQSNEEHLLKKISKHSSYTLLPYLEHSISLNIHAVIYKQDILLLPASVQLISMDADSLAYRGSDFIMYTHLPQNIQTKVNEYALIISKQLQYSGYRGVCGIDFMADMNEVYFSEINGRFQSSSILINKALHSSGHDISLQKLHIDAFENPKSSCQISDLKVNYSFYGYSYMPAALKKIKHLFIQKEKCPEIISFQHDDLDWTMDLEENTYLFKLISNTNIASIGPEFTTILQANWDITEHILNPKSYKKQLLELKIMLLKHGIRISEDVLEQSVSQGGVNCEEFEAIDLIIDNIYINVPYKIQFSELSPFSIGSGPENEFFLFYYDKPLTKAAIRTVDKLGTTITRNGLQYDDISYLGNDRLRIYYRNGCNFKSVGKGCRFCDIENSTVPLPYEDIKEVIDAYSENKSIRHFLIGGGSEPIDSDFSKVIQIAEYLKYKTNKPINLMSIPPLDLAILHKLYDAGITEVTFNLELYDRNLAKKYMPGKGSLPLFIYDNAFQEAVKIWGRNGNVRTVFIVGLESEVSLLQGVEHVCQLGVTPILSLFKPICGTSMEYLLPPPDKQVLRICHKAQTICKSYGLELGPACHYCEDNTLKLSYKEG